MRAIETSGIVDAQGHIQLDTPQPQVASSRVRVVMLLDEPIPSPIATVTPEENSQSTIRRETELLNKIHHPLPNALHQRITQLMQQRDTDQLSPTEHQELIQLSQQVELLNVDRITHLLELAKYRQTTLPQLIKDLGLKPIEYV